MNSKNDYIREYLGVDKWHKAGYTGKRVKALTGERIEGENVKEHAKQTRLAFLEIAPDATLSYAPFPGARNVVEKFHSLRGDACVMFVSLAVEGCTPKDVADAAVPDDLFICVGAGNYGDDYANGMMAPASVYGAGAVDIVWSATRNGEKAPGAKLLVQAAQYTSRGENVDFGAATGLYLDGYLGRFPGTSCAAPVLAGMAALVNDFFIHETGRPLSHKAMYQFMKDCSVDIELPGKDETTGWGIPRLPEPGKVNIKKYQPDYEEEEEPMSYNDFLKYMQQYEAQRGAKPEPTWSKQEGSWAKAKKAGIMDGTRPEDPIKRVELAAVLDRVGLLDGDAK